MEQLTLDLITCTTDINYLLFSLERFINEIKETESLYNIKIISDSVGNMDIDFSSDLAQKQIITIKERVGILDRLINTQGYDTKLKIEKGLGLFSKIKSENPDFKSEILNQLAKFNELNKAYKH